MFLDNPITGVGVGVNKQYREELTGIKLPLIMNLHVC